MQKTDMEWLNDEESYRWTEAIWHSQMHQYQLVPLTEEQDKLIHTNRLLLAMELMHLKPDNLAACL